MFRDPWELKEKGSALLTADLMGEASHVREWRGLPLGYTMQSWGKGLGKDRV
jgi:hypothetical protein